MAWLKNKSDIPGVVKGMQGIKFDFLAKEIYKMLKINELDIYQVTLSQNLEQGMKNQ